MQNSSTSGAQVQEKPTQDDLDGLLWRLVEHCWANDPKGRLWKVADDASLAKLEGVTIETMIGWKVVESGADMVERTARALVKDKLAVKAKGRFRPTLAGVEQHDSLMRQGPQITTDDQVRGAVRKRLGAHPPREEWIASQPDKPMMLDFVEVAEDGSRTIEHEIIKGSSQRRAAEISADKHPRCGGVPAADLPGHVVAALCEDGLAANEFRVTSVILNMIQAGEVERIEAGPATAYLDLRGVERQEDVWRLARPVAASNNGQDQSAPDSPAGDNGTPTRALKPCERKAFQSHQAALAVKGDCGMDLLYDWVREEFPEYTPPSRETWKKYVRTAQKAR